MNATCVVGEFANLLAAHDLVLCSPELKHEGVKFSLTLTVEASQNNDVAKAMDALNLFTELEYAIGVCQMREFASKYNIDPAELERVLKTTIDASRQSMVERLKGESGV